MHTSNERKFAAIIQLGRFIRSWCNNVEPRHEEWTREERHDTFMSIRQITGKYINVNTCTNEDIADAWREVVLKLLDGRAKVELIDD